MTSNVNIVSNVYIRSPYSLQFGKFELNADPDFVSQIFEKNALNELCRRYPANSSRVKLSDIQEKVIQNSKSCSYGLPGEQTHGIVRNFSENVWECRCENSNCSLQSDCAPHKFERNVVQIESIDTIETKLERLSLEISDDIYETNDNFSEEEILDEPDAQEITGIESISDQKYVPLSSGDALPYIIESDIQSRIVVNAGPGTGKTYTALRRLIYILSSGGINDTDGILVLCYTRAAVEEIKERINTEISRGELTPSAANIAIGTFDSLASSYLNSKNINLSSMGYNDRIEKFNTEFDPLDFEGFEYCIIDEIQDLVNDRAQMTLNILGALKCGYLLLGDRCQAIYDYDNHSGKTQIKSSDFYEHLLKLLPPETAYYELLDNKRQSGDLSKVSLKLRKSLLDSSDIIGKEFSSVLNDLPEHALNKIDFNGQFPNGKTAILCRRNCQAEYISAWLHEKNIKHKLIRGMGSHPLINRCVADILWDYSGNIISREVFIERASIRCEMDDNKANEVFDVLRSIASDDTSADFFECGELAKNMCILTNIPPVLSADEDIMLYVSTIHKSKGREYENVLLYASDYRHTDGNNEEERVYYVAFTRAKKLIFKLKNNMYIPYMSISPNGHCIKLDKFQKRATAITTGSYDDVNYFSFAHGDIEKTLEIQEYISKNISVNDKVVLLLNSLGKYDILHCGKKIGEMSVELNEAICGKYGKYQKQYFFNKLPPKIVDIYINSIFSFVSFEDDEMVPPLLRHNRFWLGIELSGFGNFKWESN